MYKTQKKIPTLLGLFLIAFGIGILSFGKNQISSFTTLADPNQKPENIKVTNITDSSFSLSWTTGKETPGAVLTKDATNHTLAFLDDLDSDGISRNRLLHQVTLKNLNSSSSYTSYIQSGQITCNQFISCPNIVQSTLAKLVKTSPEGPVYGTILNKNGQLQGAALVYLIINNKVSFSTRSDSLGKWVIPLITTGNENNDALSNTDQIEITAFDAPGESGSISLDGGILHKNREIEPLKIGTPQTLKLSLNTFESLAKSKQNLNVLGSATQNINKIEIYFPQKDNDATTDTRPRIRGSGFAGVPLNIAVHSNVQIGRVVPNSDGTWEWRPPIALTTGAHTLTVQGYDQKKKLVTLTRSFFVLKSGEAVLGDSTPSASLTPTSAPILPSPTVTPTTDPSVPTPTLTIIPSATLTPIPTITPTPSPTLTPTPTIMPTATTQPTPTIRKPQASGETLPTMALITSGIAIFALGAKFLLFP